MISSKSLTISTDITQRSIKAKVESLKEVELQKPGLSDHVDISKIAIEKNQQAESLNSTTMADEVALDSVRVSSTIGSSSSARNLTNNQATELYQEIAKLL